MKNRAIEWLESCMNTNDIFYFVQDKKEDNLINCYFKLDDIRFCTFYRDVIYEIIGED